MKEYNVKITDEALTTAAETAILLHGKIFQILYKEWILCH